jgi:CHASE3 domain sensor protein
MSLGRNRRPQNRKERRRKTSRSQKQKSEGAGRDLFIAIAAFSVVILLGIFLLAYFAS